MPRTAQRVDRVPAGDLKRIMETITAGRERMDDYRAVLVRHPAWPDQRWWTDVPIVVYRKGKKFRTEVPVDWTGKLEATKGPDQGEDLGKWWSERTKFLQYYPSYVVRGRTWFTSKVKRNTRPDGTVDAEIVSVSSMEMPEFLPPGPSMGPEFACRPRMGLGAADMEPVLEMHAPDGPRGCVRLAIRHTSQNDRMNEKGSGSPDENRYWLDPTRDYIVVRTGWVMRDAAGHEKVTQRTTAEETARSPQGVWYATKIRRSPAHQVGNEEVVGDVSELYVDFDVNLPDSLFEPRKPGKIR